MFLVQLFQRKGLKLFQIVHTTSYAGAGSIVG